LLPRILDMDPYVAVTDSMEATQTHSSAMAERHGICLYLGGRRLRLESLLLGAIGLFVVSLLALFIAFDVGAEDVERWGYAGLFGFSLLRASSVILPIPGSGMTFAAGGFMNSAWGIPAPVLVGVIAGFAESLGEFTGYAAGMGGIQMLNRRRIYHRVKDWMKRRAFMTVFAMSLMPSVLFDVAGLVAGATRVPVRVFYPAMLMGKVLRGIAMATAGFYGIGLLQQVL